MKTYFLFGFLIFTLAVFGCSIEINQPTVLTPEPTFEAAPTTMASPISSQQPNTVTTTQIPVTWAHLNLTGKLVYSIGSIDENNNYRIHVQVLDLATGEVTTVYTTPIDAWIYYLSVSPDNKQLVMSYSPPLQQDPAIVQALYVMPLDGSKPPEVLFTPRIREDQYIQAEWSPDGKYIYYTHVNYQIPNDPNRIYPLFEIFRMVYPGSEEEGIAEEAYWPRPSADSSRMVYVSVDPLSIKNQLTIADPDGGNVQEVVLTGSYIPDIKDAPLFSPDGQSIIFSGVVPVQSYQPNWFENFVGIRVARANGSIPSDWWSVPVSGGEITRLTHIQSFGLNASVSPDHQFIASYSGGGIFVMKPDGSELTWLISILDGFNGTVSWIP